MKRSSEVRRDVDVKVARSIGDREEVILEAERKGKRRRRRWKGREEKEGKGRKSDGHFEGVKARRRKERM